VNLPQLFPEWTNRIAILGTAAGLVSLVILIGAVWYFGSPEFTDVGYKPKQPMAYSHALHAGELNLDCRYCHSAVERSPVAGIPSSQQCMNCHKVITKDSELLAVLRESISSGRPIEWVRVHKTPDYAFFSHSSHVAAGVGCVTCHGRVDQMVEVRQEYSLSMSWCLDCHKNPGPHLRPVDQVTKMNWNPPADQAELAERLIAEKQLRPPLDCSGCHR
jgi:hypothetical protein